MEESLVKLDAVRVALAEATTVQEVKKVLDVAKAYEVYAQQQKAGEEIREQISGYIRTAKIKLGEMLIAAKESGQITRGGDRGNQYTGGKVPNGNNASFTLEQAGISRKLSSECQRLARSENRNEQHSKPLRKREAEATVKEMLGKGMSLNEISVQTGVRPRVIDAIVRDLKVAHDAYVKGQEDLQGEESANSLGPSDRKKFERALEFYKRKLDQEAEDKIFSTVNRMLEARAKEWRKEQEQYKAVVRARQGCMDRQTFRLILSCLHPDRVMDENQKAQYNEAFIAFKKREKLLLDEKDSPTSFMKIPQNRKEWEANI